jgi:hypothetical protein
MASVSFVTTLVVFGARHGRSRDVPYRKLPYYVKARWKWDKALRIAVTVYMVVIAAMLLITIIGYVILVATGHTVVPA